MRDTIEAIVYWATTIFFSLLVAIPLTLAFLWVVTLFVAAVQNEY